MKREARFGPGLFTKMTLIILICHLYVCDRIVQTVQSCTNSAMSAQMILAQTDRYQAGDQLVISCVPAMEAKK